MADSHSPPPHSDRWHIQDGSDDEDEDEYDSEKFIIDFPLRFLSNLKAHFLLKEKPWKSGMNMKTTILSTEARSLGSDGSDDEDEDDSEKFIIDFPLRFLSDLEAHFRLNEKQWKSGMNIVRFDSAVLSGVSLMLCACINWLKLTSFVHTNYGMRSLVNSTDKLEVRIKELNQECCTISKSLTSRESLFLILEYENVYVMLGMRVLAVDDDPTCLKLLDCLLRKCQYQG
ncbi:hypothetical protein L1987_05393 [Smallanthus sonchifolius]|uniref:Uncharacterized protein n=1 Tax=Smallanthus sonchifolius TaxID=185202 RepID=A0ACB9JV79_9ASTR|nr:hypothetical protein L1987_05393 [Smallanthus sonchifolius]